ncbi:hypothetical protein SETIT_5G265400v2 [Setaria italica]|uniref:Uncharacterized protein n=1 Tax=Setaria italica TaxID=4555 RepID=A0A368R937_SETIT|nr:hypothetical protein SETIT_5G265400v2 [Setaria italica]
MGGSFMINGFLQSVETSDMFMLATLYGRCLHVGNLLDKIPHTKLICPGACNKSPMTRWHWSHQRGNEQPQQHLVTPIHVAETPFLVPGGRWARRRRDAVHCAFIPNVNLLTDEMQVFPVV